MGTLSYSPSASSLADIPTAPYPVGSAMGNLALPSSGLRPDLISGSNTRTYSKTGPAHSGTQQPGQSFSSSGGSSTGHGGEVSTSS